MSFKRRLCRFDGPDDDTYVEVWQSVGTFEIVRCRPYPPPTRGRKIDTFIEDTSARALSAAASIARDLFDRKESAP